MSGHYLIEQRLIYKRSIRSRKKGEVKGEEQRCQVYIVRRGVWTPLFNPSPPSWHPPSFGGPLFTVIQSNFERCISYHNCYVSLLYSNSQLYFVTLENNLSRIKRFLQQGSRSLGSGIKSGLLLVTIEFYCNSPNFPLCIPVLLELDYYRI